MAFDAVTGVAHAVAESEVNEGAEGVTFHAMPQPGGVLPGGMDDAEEVVEADDGNQRRVFEQPDESVGNAGDDGGQRLRQDDEAHLRPVTEAEAVGRFKLSARDGLQAAAHHLRHVGRGKEGDANQRAHQVVDMPGRRQEQRQHDVCHKEHCYQRHAAPQLDKSDADAAQERHVGGAAERQQNAKRQGKQQPGGGDHQRQHHPAPEIWPHFRQAKDAAAQQIPRQHRQHEQRKQQRQQALAPAAAPQREEIRRDDAEEEQPDAPALAFRVKTVKELAQPHLDEDPASAAGGAIGGGRTAKIRLPQRPVEERQHDAVERIQRQHGQKRVQGRGEQIAAQPAPQAKFRGRRRAVGQIRKITHRSTILMRRL